MPATSCLIFCIGLQAILPDRSISNRKAFARNQIEVFPDEAWLLAHVTLLERERQGAAQLLEEPGGTRFSLTPDLSGLLCLGLHLARGHNSPSQKLSSTGLLSRKRKLSTKQHCLSRILRMQRI